MKNMAIVNNIIYESEHYEKSEYEKPDPRRKPEDLFPKRILRSND